VAGGGGGGGVWRVGAFSSLSRMGFVRRCGSGVPAELAKVQDDEVGDGTTSVCVLASELLREAEKLVNQKVHPQTVVEGYRLASKAALTALEASAVDYGNDPVKFENELLSIAKTTLSSKVRPACPAAPPCRPCRR